VTPGPQRRKRALALRSGLIYLLPVVLVVISLSIGRYTPAGPLVVVRVLLSRVLPIHHSWSMAVDTIVMQVRLPRVVLAVAVGGGLAVGGASLQGLFRNPLVSPEILGVSSAAGFGAALAILIWDTVLTINTLAFAFGFAGALLTYAVARVRGTVPIVMLVLSGVVVASLFGALISLLEYVADPQRKLPDIVFWLLGSLAGANETQAEIAGGLIAAGTAVLIVLSWRINLLSLGDEEARSLGVRTEAVRAAVVAAVTLITAAAVAVSGIIGWVGLVIPHVARMLVGPDHRRLLPASFALGASYLLIIDDLSRTISTQEVPIGILTALIGAPFFAVLLRRTRAGWQ
jgi:iron complex transport system permease protein